MDQITDTLKNFQQWKYMLYILMERQESSLFSDSEILFHDYLKVTSLHLNCENGISSIHGMVTLFSHW